jgi:hypothetical protein
MALDNDQPTSKNLYPSSVFILLWYCGRVVMASRLGSDQSVMGNLASSNLVSASFFFTLVGVDTRVSSTSCGQRTGPSDSATTL